MIDIGSGRGIYSLFAAFAGARRVQCLEPELTGSRNGGLDVFERLMGELGVEGVHLLRTSFQDYDAHGETFDVILVHNSINHLDEDACVKLKWDRKAQETYRRLFSKLGSSAHPGTKLIVADCSRYNFFGMLGIKNPMASSIKWHTHQSPRLWACMLKQHGFRNPQIRWTAPGKLSKLLLDNPVAAFFLISHFVLSMEKTT
jgi:SAM-dependent methyltransferase